MLRSESRGEACPSQNGMVTSVELWAETTGGQAGSDLILLLFYSHKYITDNIVILNEY